MIQSEPRATPAPRLHAPTTHQEAGLSPDLLMRLTLKTLSAAGELSGNELARRMGVLFSVVEPSLDFIKLQRQCEVVAGAMVGASSYRYRISSEGRTAAALFAQHDEYVGPAPVPIAQYRRYMDALRKSTESNVTRTAVREAYRDLVLGNRMLDEIGTAARGGRSLFIYGPPGNGKTVIAQGLQRLLRGAIAIPHALEVEGMIIRVYDPVNHEANLALSIDEGQLAVEPSPTDERWVMCQRPIVKVGGELTLEALDLTFDRRLGHYRAPVQVIANGGVLIVDDFGRQRCSPADLLNRWMVPLESGVDYLTLRSGQKFEIPFMAFVAFATNIKPSDLVDEAFLRRVPFKVFAESPTRLQFIQICEKYCVTRNIDFHASVIEHVLDGFYTTHNITTRACHARDLITQALLLADYRGEPRVLTPELLDTACENYFLEEQA